MDTQVVLPKKDGVVMIGDKWLHINKDTRDIIVAANTFLATLADKTEENQTKFYIWRVMSGLSGMLYGFEENE